MLLLPLCMLLQCEKDGSANEYWFGYKFVGDNVDKNIRPSYQRMEHHRGQSLHYFHGYALRDRVDLSNYSDATSPYVTPNLVCFFHRKQICLHYKMNLKC